MTEPIEITITDPNTGEVLGMQILENDYAVICAGNRFVEHVNTHANGTHVVTIKVNGDSDE